MPKALDITGVRFGRLTAISYHSSSSQGRNWLCKCDCGTETYCEANQLKRGHKRSCGCLQIDHARKIKTTHGMANTPTHNSWKSMIARCNYKGNGSYPRYGGRGISVCERWLISFENFYADMGEKPLGKTLDRIDVNGNYELTNCRWATDEEQDNNKTTSVKVTIDGVTMTYSQWGRKLNQDPCVLRWRYLRFGTFERIRAPRKVKTV